MEMMQKPKDGANDVEFFFLDMICSQYSLIYNFCDYYTRTTQNWAFQCYSKERVNAIRHHPLPEAL